jgi:hypothetical protein
MPLERIVLGRFGGAMILSQENCLYNDHRFTCERWGGDFDAFLHFFVQINCLHGIRSLLGRCHRWLLLFSLMKYYMAVVALVGCGFYVTSGYIKEAIVSVNLSSPEINGSK